MTILCGDDGFWPLEGDCEEPFRELFVVSCDSERDAVKAGTRIADNTRQKIASLPQS